MRTRLLAVIAAVIATGVLALIGALLLVGETDREVPTSFTVAVTTTSATATTEPAGPTTTIGEESTTTEPGPAVVRIGSDANSPHLLAEVQKLYTWLGDRSAEQPNLPPGMADHLAPITVSEDLDLTATVVRRSLEDGSRVAVVTLDDDVILAVAETSRWQIVGAKLGRFGVEPWYGPAIRHVFIIGTDARPGENQPRLRADSLHIISASLADRAGGILGIPRDTWVAASYGNDKFTHVNARSDSAEMVEIAGSLSGLPLEGYILTGFQGFKEIVNNFGGLEIEVPFAMSDPKSSAFFEAGVQVMRGGQALAFSRNRSIRGGDFTRSYHQGVVIQAGLTGAQALGIEELPRLIAIIDKSAWTDLTPAQLLTLGAIAFELDPRLVGNAVLPGSVATIGGSSVVRLDPAADDYFADLADGRLTPD